MHAYTHDGTPLHRVPYADKKRKGKTRDTTLSDVKKLGLLPSVSHYKKNFPKQGLYEVHIIPEILRLAWENQPSNDDFFDEWSSSIKRMQADNLNDAAKLGTLIHDELERLAKGELSLDEATEEASCTWKRYQVAKDKIVGIEEVIVETSDIGYGGTIDLHYFDEDGVPWIRDYKSWRSKGKENDEPFYSVENCIQLSAYAYAIDKKYGYTPRIENIYISVTEPGVTFRRTYSETLQKKYFAMFLHLHFLTCHIDNYWPLKSTSKTKSK